MSTTIQVKRDTAANWTATNRVLKNGEIGYETDTDKFKIGDGSTAWSSLTYFTKNPGGGTWGTITGTLSAQTDLQTALDAAVKLTGNQSVAGVKTFASSPIVPTPTTAFQAAPKGYVDGLAFTPGTSALHFNEALGQHVNCGPYWTVNNEYGKFFYEAWVNVEIGAQYIISDDYGGAHNLLWGFDGGDVNGYTGVTGNVWFNGAPVSIAAQDGLYAGDWHHVAVGWDGAFLYTWLDGVISKRVAATGVRTTIGVSVTGIIFIGGSNHSNYSGYIRSIRGVEGRMPIVIPNAYTPEHNFKSSYQLSDGEVRGSNFLIDLSTPQGTIADLSDGFSNGKRQAVSNTVVAAAGITSNGDARSIVTANGMTHSPKTITIPVTTALTTATAIATAFRAALAADVDIANFFIVGGTGATIKLTAIEPQANDTTMNFTIENVTSVGITNSATATVTTPGFAGWMVKHPGIAVSQSDPLLIGQLVYDGAGYNGFGTNLPTFQTVNFAAPSVFHGTPLSIPGGAIVYDDFSKADITWAWYQNLSPGTARTGQTPTVPNNDVGIIDGCAYTPNVSGGPATVFGSTGAGHAVYDAATVTQDVRLIRKVASSDGSNIGILLRYTDENNYIMLWVNAGQLVVLNQRIAGAVTSLSGVSGSTDMGGTSWLRLRVAVSGSTVTAYNESDVVIFTGTTSLLTGTKAGFFTSPYGRINSIDVR